MNDFSIGDEGNAADTKWRIMQYVSEPLPAQTISGTIKGQIRAGEEALLDNYDRVVIGIRVVSNDGATVRGTLLAVGSYAAANEFTLNSVNKTNRKIADGDALSSLAISANDRLVIELGVMTAGSTGFDGSEILVLGDDSGTDLPEDETTTAANNAWIEFSADLFFYVEICSSVGGGGGCGQPSAAVSTFSVGGEGGCGIVGGKTSCFSVGGEGGVGDSDMIREDSYDPTYTTSIPVTSGPAMAMKLRATTPAELGDDSRGSFVDGGQVIGPGSGDYNLFAIVMQAASGADTIAHIILHALVSTDDTVPFPNVYVPVTAPSAILKLSGGSRTPFGFASAPSITVPGNVAEWISAPITTKPGGGAWTWEDLNNLVECGVTAHYTLGTLQYTTLRLDEVWLEIFSVQGSIVAPLSLALFAGDTRLALTANADLNL